jgi:hypothetical protein
MKKTAGASRVTRVPVAKGYRTKCRADAVSKRKESPQRPALLP